MANRTIIGVRIDARQQNVPAVQAILTEYGCNIRTRLGMHEVSGDYCSPGGLVLLDMYGDQAEVDACFQKLTAVPGVGVQRMDFAL